MRQSAARAPAADPGPRQSAALARVDLSLRGGELRRLAQLARDRSAAVVQRRPQAAVPLNPLGAAQASRAIVQRVTMRAIREAFADRPYLLEVFKYWIRFEMKQSGIPNHADFLATHSLNEVRESLEVWSQDANFAHLREQESELDAPTRQTEPKAPEPRALKGEPMSGLSQQAHRDAAIERITAAKQMVRKMNKLEADVFYSEGYDIDRLRPKGLLNNDAFPVERSIAFALETTFRFGDAARNRDADAYGYILTIDLTSALKEFLQNNLWNTNRSGGYGSNPQFKFEHDNYNIIIPETGWSEFWKVARAGAVISGPGGAADYSRKRSDEDWNRSQHAVAVGFGLVGKNESIRPQTDHSESYIS